jgi:2-polyprenyl-6-methoxyphenol hydroxylase-like FAD-dependent oxidoreductase
MPAKSMVGRQAIVVGASVAGLSAAAALAPFFEQVLVLERDRLPDDTGHRPGTPQSRHPHALLIGGLRALCALMPDFERELLAAGAIRLNNDIDLRIERPGYDLFPPRDLGLYTLAVSRPAIDHAARRCLASLGNVTLRGGARVRRLVASPDGAVAGVTIESTDGSKARQQTLTADLVVDASGRGALTAAFLKDAGFPGPDETVIGIDLAYATGVFEIPRDAPGGWKSVMTFGEANTLGALLWPIEGNRWIVALGGRHDHQARPGDLEAYLAFARTLRTPTVFEAIRSAKPESPIARIGFRESVRRHYERLERFPRGLVPIGDAICRFNPVYGQGMSVAAQEACLLKRLLGERSTDPLPGLARAFLAEVPTLLETPWGVAEFDFALPETRGERPADFDFRLKFSRALTQLVAEDEAVNRLVTEVNHLIKPRSAYRESGVSARVMAMIT